MGEFPIAESKLNLLITSSYHASSLQDYYENNIFEVYTVFL